MADRRQIADRRAQYRCPVVSGRKFGHLDFGDLSLEVQVFDESAGGFAVLTEDASGVSQDQVGRLDIDCGLFEVRVKHVGRYDPTSPQEQSAEAAASDTQVAADSPAPGKIGWRIGLQCCSELGREMPSSRKRAARLRKALSWIRGGWPLILPLGAAVAAGFIIGAIYTTKVKQVPSDLAAILDMENWAESVRQSAGAATVELDEISQTVRQWRAAGMRDWMQPTASAAPFTNQLNSLDLPLRSRLRGKILHLPGAMPLMAPEVIQMLELTDAQKTSIRAIVDASAKAVADVNLHWREKGRRAIDRGRDKILNNAREEALQLLSPEQRQHWGRLIESAGGEDQPSGGAANP